MGTDEAVGPQGLSGLTKATSWESSRAWALSTVLSLATAYRTQQSICQAEAGEGWHLEDRDQKPIGLTLLPLSHPPAPTPPSSMWAPSLWTIWTPRRACGWCNSSCGR